MFVNNKRWFLTLKHIFFSNLFRVFLWTLAWRNCKVQPCDRRALTHHPAGSSQPLFSNMTHNAPLPTHAEARLRWQSICFCFLNPMKANGVEAQWIYSIDPPLLRKVRKVFMSHINSTLISLISNRSVCYCKTCCETCLLGQSTHQREFYHSVGFSDMMLIAF